MKPAPGPLYPQPAAPRYPTREQIADELHRIIETLRREYPRMLEEGRIQPELAEHRLACLRAAWSYIVDPRLVLVSDGHYCDAMDFALALVDARRLQIDWDEPPLKALREENTRRAQASLQLPMKGDPTP